MTRGEGANSWGGRVWGDGLAHGEAATAGWLYRLGL